MPGAWQPKRCAGITPAMNHSPAHASALSRIAPIVFALLQVVTPLLPWLGIGAPVGEQSDSVRTIITPAGWAFSIWGALYTGCFVFVVYQALRAQRRNALLAELRWPAAGAFLGNAGWVAYVQVYGLSAISAAIIVFTLACLLTIYRSFAEWRGALSTGERWCAVLPLSALASWLTAATVVNIAAALRYHGVEGGEATPLIGAGVILVAGAIAAAALIKGRGNPPYALVFLWALAGIYAAGGQRADAIAVAAAASGLIVIAAAALGLRRRGVARFA